MASSNIQAPSPVEPKDKDALKGEKVPVILHSDRESYFRSLAIDGEPDPIPLHGSIINYRDFGPDPKGRR